MSQATATTTVMRRSRLTVGDGRVRHYAMNFVYAGEGAFGKRYNATGPFDVSASRNGVVVHHADLRTFREGLLLTTVLAIAQLEHMRLQRGDLPAADDDDQPQPVTVPDEPADLTFAEVTRVNLSRCNRWHPGGIHDWTPERWYSAMQGELGEFAGALLLLAETSKHAGEVGNALKKLFRVEDQIANLSEPGREIQSREAAIAKIGEELADTFLYLNLLACRLDINLEQQVVAKFNQVSERYGFPERLPETSVQA